jgi:hypothetical protein
MPARPFLVRFAIALLLLVGIMLAMGRPPVCTCGTVALWGPVGPTQSQMLADWYSPSHIVHGFLFYGALWLALRRWPLKRRFSIALMVEAAWEIFENTPMVIDRYREATIALGYSGDSILNSASDLTMMAVGFWLARRLPVWASVAIVVALELAALWAVRDNLTLNVWMLLAPNPQILAWQAGG